MNNKPNPSEDCTCCNHKHKFKPEAMWNQVCSDCHHMNLPVSSNTCTMICHGKHINHGEHCPVSSGVSKKDAEIAMINVTDCQMRCGDGTGKKPDEHVYGCPFWKEEPSSGDKTKFETYLDEKIARDPKLKKMVEEEEEKLESGVKECACGGDPAFTRHSQYECHNDIIGIAIAAVGDKGKWRDIPSGVTWEERFDKQFKAAVDDFTRTYVVSEDIKDFIRKVEVQALHLQREQIRKRFSYLDTELYIPPSGGEHIRWVRKMDIDVLLEKLLED